MKLFAVLSVVSGQLIAWDNANGNVDCKIIGNATHGGPNGALLDAGSLPSQCCAAYATGAVKSGAESGAVDPTTLSQCHATGFGGSCTNGTYHHGDATALQTAGAIMCQDNRACKYLSDASMAGNAATAALNPSFIAGGSLNDWDEKCNVTNTGGVKASCKPFYAAPTAAGTADFGSLTFDCCSAISGFAAYSVYGSITLRTNVTNAAAVATIGSPCYAVGKGQSCDSGSGAPTLDTVVAVLEELCNSDYTAGSACGNEAFGNILAANFTEFPLMASLAGAINLGNTSVTTFDSACPFYKAAANAAIAAAAAAAATTAAPTTAAPTTAAATTAAATGAAAVTTAAGSGSTATTQAAATNAAATSGSATTTTEAASTTAASGSAVAKAMLALLFA